MIIILTSMFPQSINISIIFDSLFFSPVFFIIECIYYTCSLDIHSKSLVWLVGVLLRGTFQCTALPKVFDPSLAGWGAGTVLGAKCTHQEWIATFMLGWFGSEYYWKLLFGCDGPPFGKDANEEFNGVPISITKVRIL